MTTATKAPQTPPIDPFDRLRDDILTRWSNQLELMELHGEGDQQTLLVVADRLNDTLQSALARQLQEQFPDQTPQLKVLDRDTFETIQQLVKTGILNASQASARTLYRVPTADRPEDDGQSRRLAGALEHLARGEHKRRMAKVLADGGFTVEALAPMREAVEISLQALIEWQGHNCGTPPDLKLIDSVLVKTNLLPAENLSHIARLRDEQSEWDEVHAGEFIRQSESIFSQAASLLGSV
jgi:hypothetical protein